MDFSTDKVQLNPECDEQRCRICYDIALPLISLCQCSGSIAFVHEECILDWITKKMQASQIVQIPSCQICKAQYSAKMKIGNKKICAKLLMQKIKALKAVEIISTITYIVGLFISLYIIISASYCVIIEQSLGFFDNFFTYFFFPYHFLKYSLKHLKKRKKIAQDSVIQIVEVTLLPKMSIK